MPSADCPCAAYLWIWDSNSKKFKTQLTTICLAELLWTMTMDNYRQWMVFLTQVTIQVLHVLKIGTLIRTQFPPRILFLENTEREHILIGRVQYVGSNIWKQWHNITILLMTRVQNIRVSCVASPVTVKWTNLLEHGVATVTSICIFSLVSISTSGLNLNINLLSK